MLRKIGIRSYAKINLYLKVLRKREDGYHDVRTVMQLVDLHDWIEIGGYDGKGVSLILEGGEEIEGENLMVKAYRMMEGRLGCGGIELRLMKRIPIGGGLGGGSSNAGNILVGLNEYCHGGLSEEELMGYGLRLGADVPFFIGGNGVALAEGVGERLEFMDTWVCDFGVLIVYPVGLRVSTQEVYGRYDEGGDFEGGEEEWEGMVKGLECGDLKVLGENLYNSFEGVQFKRYPILREIKEVLKDLGAYGALMSGTGSCIYGVFGVDRNWSNGNMEKLKILGEYGLVYRSRSLS